MRIRTALIAAALTPLLAATGTAAADVGGRPLSTDLTGSEEAPGPGDPNATGQIDLTFNQGAGEICFDASWADIDGEVFAAHIHLAPTGEPGPVVVPLFAGSFEGTDAVSDCVAADPGLVKAIRKDPTAYYVNVHSRPDFPGGAIRGQLGD